MTNTLDLPSVTSRWSEMPRIPTADLTVAWDLINLDNFRYVLRFESGQLSFAGPATDADISFRLSSDQLYDYLSGRLTMRTLLPIIGVRGPLVLLCLASGLIESDEWLASWQRHLTSRSRSQVRPWRLSALDRAVTRGGSAV